MNLITSLTRFSIIRELHLLNCTIVGFESCKALGELLASSKYIEVLDIGGNKLSPDNIQLIVDGLSHSTSLEKLGMSNSSFSSANVYPPCCSVESEHQVEGVEHWGLHYSE